MNHYYNELSKFKNDTTTILQPHLIRVSKNYYGLIPAITDFSHTNTKISSLTWILMGITMAQSRIKYATFAKYKFKQEEYFRNNHLVIFLFFSLCNGVGTKISSDDDDVTRFIRTITSNFISGKPSPNLRMP